MAATPVGATTPSWVKPAAIVAAIALLVGIVVAVTGGNGGKAASGGEIFLQPTSADGPNPFTATTASPPPSSTIPPVTEAPAAQGTGGKLTITARPGGLPGLYGGTRDQSFCDKQKMIDFLQANPAKERAWAQAEGITAAQVPDYVNGLTPVLLRADTRVTNHGYRNGRANAYQAILQAGTAVLVDQYGVPRARCACGNPLTPPVAVPVTPSYQGDPWPGFSPTNVTVVQQNTTVINVITIVDITDNTTININIGGNGMPTPDTPQPPPGQQAPPLLPAQPAGGGSPTTPTTRPPTAGSGWHLKKTVFVLNGTQPDYQIVSQPGPGGGAIRWTIHSDGSTFCRGTETIELHWAFDRSVTSVTNGDSIGVSVDASEIGQSDQCTNQQLASLTGLSARGISGDGSMPRSDFDQAVDDDRLGGNQASAAGGSGQGSPQSGTGTFVVNSAPSDPKKPEAGWHVTFEGPGIEFWVLYIFEQA